MGNFNNITFFFILITFKSCEVETLPVTKVTGGPSARGT